MTWIQAVSKHKMSNRNYYIIQKEARTIALNVKVIFTPIPIPQLPHLEGNDQEVGKMVERWEG